MSERTAIERCDHDGNKVMINPDDFRQALLEAHWKTMQSLHHLTGLANVIRNFFKNGVFEQKADYYLSNDLQAADEIIEQTIMALVKNTYSSDYDGEDEDD